MVDLLGLKSRLKRMLKKDRYNHSLRVEKEAVKLAGFWGEDKQKAAIAGLLHDCGRYVEGSDLLKEARKYGIKITKFEEFEPKLVHAPLSAVVAKIIFGINDKKILSSIALHTLGSEKMTLLDKIIYLADHIESGRRFLDVKKIRRLAYKNMDTAIIASISSMIGALANKGLPIHDQTFRTRNAFVMRNVK